MTRLKLHIAYTFLVAFAVTGVTAILGATGVVPIPQGGLIGIFAFLITQCITVITTVLKAPNYFDDPPAVARLNEEHGAKIVRLLESHSQNRGAAQETIASLQKEVAQLAAQREADAVNFRSEKRKWLAETQRLQTQLAASKPRPIGPAPGSARTHQSRE